MYRKERDSMQLDLYLDDRYLFELFSFLKLLVEFEEVRIDAPTSKRFFCIQDPDALPIEFHEI